MSPTARRGAAVATAAACALAVPVLSGCSSGAATASSAPASSSAAGTSATAGGPATSASDPGTSPAPSVSTAPPPRATEKPSVAVSTAPPVKVGGTATLKPDVLVALAAPRAISVTANGPGEVAGAAVAVTVTVRNRSSSAFDLGGLDVNASYGTGAGTPASPTDADPAKPLRGSLAGGASATGTYVFTAPRSALSRLRVEVSSNSAARIVVFRS